MKTIKIAIADDHVLFRRGLTLLLKSQAQFEVVLEAGTGLQLVQRMSGIPVDVVLMDIEMPDMNGIDATQQLKREYPDVRVVMLSSHNEDEMILNAIEQGARGYLLKDSDADEVIEAVKTVVHNGFCFNKDVSTLVLKSIVQKNKLQPTFNPLPQLTEREREVLHLICKEMTNAEIGDKLCLSPRTVESYRQNMMVKTGARNSVGLVMFGLKNGLLDLDSVG